MTPRVSPSWEIGNTAVRQEWIDAFSFSEDLAELEQQQRIQFSAIEENTLPPSEFEQTAANQKSPTPHTDASHKTIPFSRKAKHSDNYVSPLNAVHPNHFNEPPLVQANRILDLERQLALLRAENEELRADNGVMARQIHSLLDERSAIEMARVRKQTAHRQLPSVWRNFHLPR